MIAPDINASCKQYTTPQQHGIHKSWHWPCCWRYNLRDVEIPVLRPGLRVAWPPWCTYVLKQFGTPQGSCQNKPSMYTAVAVQGLCATAPANIDACRAWSDSVTSGRHGFLHL